MSNVHFFSILLSLKFLVRPYPCKLYTCIIIPVSRPLQEKLLSLKENSVSKLKISFNGYEKG